MALPLKQFTKKDLEDDRLLALNDFLRQVTQEVNSMEPVGQRLAWKGTWLNSTTYAVNDLVKISGLNYVSTKANNKNHPPAKSPSFWDALV